MENLVLFRDNQEVQAADFINLQDYAQTSFDDIVNDAIETGMAFAGFTISQNGPTQINVAPGRLYNGGKVYANTGVSAIDLYNSLPVTQQRYVAVVAWGSTIQQDVEPRDFIIDADTGQSQPQSVAMLQSRYANVDIVNGVEAPQPTFPAVDATNLVLGYVLLNPTGIVSIIAETDNRLTSLQTLARDMLGVLAFESQISGQVATLATALAALAAQLDNYTLLTDFQKLVTLVNEIWKLVHQAPTYVWYGTDNFLDTSQSDLGANIDGLYNAKIGEGLRFPGGGASGQTQLQLLNANDPNVSVTANGMMIPTPSGSRVRMDCSFLNLPWITERILLYIYWTFTIRVLRPSRHRHRCGPPYLPCPASQVWWYQAQVDPTVHILSFPTESWEVAQWTDIDQHAKEDNPDWPQHKFERLKYLWHDCVDLPYWSKVYDNFNHAGNHICQTFLNAQDGWLNGVTVFMMNQLPQPLTVIISMCDDDGTPNHEDNSIQRVVLDGNSVQSCFAQPVQVGDVEVIKKTTIPLGWGNLSITLFRQVYLVPTYVYPMRVLIPPTFLMAGKRYAIHFLTTSDHQFAVSDQWDCFEVHQGAYWVSGSAGLYRWTSSPKSVRFLLHYATWGQWQGQSPPTGTVTATIAMQPLQQAGGIHGVDVLADAIIPPATKLSYQLQVAGNWYPFDCDPNQPTLAGNPALTPFQIVFNGTTDLMPAVSLSQSQVLLEPPNSNSFHHIGNSITLGSPMTHIEIMARLVGFNAAHHSCTASIHYGGTSPGTHASASVVGDTPNDDGSITRTWTFNLGGPITSFFPELDGTTDGAVDPFVVSQEIRYAAP